MSAIGKHGWMLACGVMVAVTAGPAAAQSMDYGSLEQLFGEPVTTSVTGSPQRVTEAPANITIVTADEIRRSGARDIPGILRHVPGVDFLQWGNDNTDVAIRGYNQAYAARTLVLIDGRQIYADYYGFIPWSALPVELGAIRQIEIVKGPSAALFGFNAVGGVINIITYNPRYDDTNSITARAGTQGLAEVSGVATIKAGPLGALRLSGRYRTDTDFDTAIPTDMQAVPRRTNDRLSFDAEDVVALTGSIELNVRASHTQAHVNEMSPGYASMVSRYLTNSVEAGLLADTDFGLMKFSAYTNWIDWNGAPGFVPVQFSLNNRVTVAQIEDAFDVGTDHTFRLALSYRNNEVNTTPVPGGTISYDVYSASGMWSWRMTPAVSLTNAIRLDHLAFGRSGTVPADYPFTNDSWNRVADQISFNSGLVWSVSTNDMLRFMAGRGVQLPNLVEAGGLVIDAPPYLWISGTPYLKPTSVTNYEINWSHAFEDIDAKLQAGAFHQDTTNIVSLSGAMVPGTYYVTPENIGSSRANGLEITASGLVGARWHWSVGYRLEAVEDRFAAGAENGSDYVDYQHSTPKHMIKANIGWSDDDWETDVFLAYQSDTAGLRANPVASYLVPVGSYAAVDAHVGYRLTDWATLSITGRNLLQNHMRQTSGALVERQLFVTLSLKD